MTRNEGWRIRLAQILCAAAIVLFLFLTRGIHADSEPIHMVTDWSARHVVFSPPKNLMQAFRLSGNTRYVQQWIRRNGPRNGPRFGWPPAGGPDTLQTDWSVNLGSGATVGAANYPAKYSFNAISASCSDFVVYNTGLGGATGQATIVAFDKIYTGATGDLCGGSGVAPSTYWAYNTNVGAGTDSIVTSPTLSADGTQVAFIQSTSGGTAHLVLLRWKANNGTLSTPADPALAASNSAYYNSGTGCTAPCMFAITFTAGANLGSYTDGIEDTVSSPFYDFGSDTLYVGDNSGYIHKFHPVFSGAPAEVTTTFPVIVSETPLSSPVYDSDTGWLFITASYDESDNSGGRLHALCVTSMCGTVGTTVASGILGPSTDGGTCNETGTTATSGSSVSFYVDSPIVDSTNNTIYVPIANDSTGKSALYQFASGYGTHTCGTEVTLGTGTDPSTGGTAVPLYTGDFDNLYYSGSAGHMYICGNTGGDATLYQIAVPSDGVLTAGAATAGPALTTATVGCSGVTENDSGGNDYIFLSVTNDAVTNGRIGCGTAQGCIMSFIVGTGSGFSSLSTNSHALEAGGTSGIVVDGSSTATGASQVYFTPLSNQTCTTSLTTGGCAIQAAQSGL